VTGESRPASGTMSEVKVDKEGATMTSTSSRSRGRRLTWYAACVVLAAAWAAALPAAAVPRTAPTVFPVCIEMGGQAGPDIAGNMAVWTDNRNGNLDVYGRNLKNKTDVAVCQNKAQQDNPSVTATVVGRRTEYVAVWVDKRNHDGGDIYGRNITTKDDFVVVRSGTLKWFPEIADHWVVWIEADDSAGPYTIKARDLAAGKSYRIATSNVLSSLGVGRRTVGTRTVYTAVYTSSDGDISGRNLPAGAPFRVAQTTRFEWSPDISANRVVWWEAGGRVMLKNLKTGKRTYVAQGSRPRIDGELVTWDGGGRGGSFTITYKAGAAIYVRNIARSKNTVKITQKDVTCLFPAIGGRTVVWESGPAKRVLSHIHIYGARVK
jgi:beta propeller repeat protein